MQASRSTATPQRLVGIITILIAIVLPMSAQANKITFPFTIDKGLPIAELKIGDNTIKVLLDTGAANRIIFGKNTAETLKLTGTEVVNAPGVGGTAKATKTTVPEGSIVGAEGTANVAPVKGDGFFLDMNLPFGAIAGAQFLRTDDKNGAFVLNSATGKATIYDKAQAEKLTALPLNTPATAVASGSLTIPDTGTMLSAMADIVNGTTSVSSPFILSIGVSNTLISSTVASMLGTLTPGFSEEVTTELGTFTIPTALLSLDVFSQQDPTTLNIGILPDSLNPDNVNVLGMDFLGAYPVLLLNAATSTFSASSVVPEPATWFLWAAGLLVILGCNGWRDRTATGTPVWA